MDQARTSFIAEKIAATGLDVAPINNELTELTDALKKSPTEVAPGEQAVQRTDVLVNKASEDYKQLQNRPRCEHWLDRTANADDLFET